MGMLSSFGSTIRDSAQLGLDQRVRFGSISFINEIDKNSFLTRSWGCLGAD
jgi:hypothetical protein